MMVNLACSAPEKQKAKTETKKGTHACVRAPPSDVSARLLTYVRVCVRSRRVADDAAFWHNFGQSRKIGRTDTEWEWRDA